VARGTRPAAFGLTFYMRLFEREDDRERKRFYLLPGQGGRAYHRKQRLFLKTSLAVGLIVSGLLALVMYLIYRSPK
jgi:hypothetical protein